MLNACLRHDFVFEQQHRVPTLARRHAVVADGVGHPFVPEAVVRQRRMAAVVALTVALRGCTDRPMIVTVSSQVARCLSNGSAPAASGRSGRTGDGSAGQSTQHGCTLAGLWQLLGNKRPHWPQWTAHICNNQQRSGSECAGMNMSTAHLCAGVLQAPALALLKLHARKGLKCRLYHLNCAPP